LETFSRLKINQQKVKSKVKPKMLRKLKKMKKAVLIKAGRLGLIARRMRKKQSFIKMGHLNVMEKIEITKGEALHFKRLSRFAYKR
jgi:hypothetical protein